MIKVFFVEDDEIFAFLVETKLMQLPEVSLEVFPLGQPCLDQLSQNPDVIFLDYSLPVLDGLEVLRRIKAENPNIPVIMLSGMEWDSVVSQCLQAGALDFIQKDHLVAQKVHEKLKEMFPQIS